LGGVKEKKGCPCYTGLCRCHICSIRTCGYNFWALQIDTIKGGKFLDKYISVKKEMGETENYEYWVGIAYRNSNIPVEAVAHIRNAIKKRPSKCQLSNWV